MKLTSLNQRPRLAKNKKYLQFEKLLQELQKVELTEEVIHQVNAEIKLLNSLQETEKLLEKQLVKSQYNILKLIEKELKLVSKNHYRRTWLALGMSAFGIPLGLVFGLSLGNMAFLGIGLPFGFGLGIAIGSALDKKASKNGKQLDLDIIY